MKKTKLLAILAVPFAAAALAAAAVAGRSESPTTTCPLTGETIPVDQCPLGCCAPLAGP